MSHYLPNIRKALKPRKIRWTGLTARHSANYTAVA